MFELHIEQGPILEDEQKMIGVVTGVQGMRWYEVTVTGQDAHTGATPMQLRKNALLGAARMIEQIDAIALEHAPDAVGAVGLIENKPNSRNVVPGEVFFTVDFRHPDDKVLDVMEAESAHVARRNPRPAEAHLRGKADLEFAGGEIRARADRVRARTAREKAGFTIARHGLRRRPRRRLYRARRADHHDLRALRRRHLATTRRKAPASTNAPPARRSCSTPCWSTIEGWGDLVGCAVRANLSSPPLRGRVREGV